MKYGPHKDIDDRLEYMFQPYEWDNDRGRVRKEIMREDMK